MNRNLSKILSSVVDLIKICKKVGFCIKKIRLEYQQKSSQFLFSVVYFLKLAKKLVYERKNYIQI